MHTPARILIVDDEAAARDTLGAFLSLDNYDVFFAADGLDALEQCARISPDVILLDVMMPGMDGFTVCERLKSDKRWQHIPIILASALSRKEDITQGIESGADEFLVKPISGFEVRVRVRSMLRIKQQFDELSSTLRLREDLASMIVHDMRSPLTSILGVSELMLFRGDFDDTQKKDIELIHKLSNRLNSFTNDLLMLAKMENDQIILNRSDCDANLLINETIESFKMLAESRAINLTVDLSEQDPPPISLDANLFRRVMDNLISNALKVSPPDSTLTLQVNHPIREPDQPPYLQVKVIDEGPGIAVEDRERIFDKFEIVALKQSGAPQIGLGLAFCKLVVEAHDGRIFVEDNYPQGSIFTLEL
ncbi:MAG: hybrid sensor histidine kinase/response regulator [Chloroflexota bacterium]